MSHIIGSYSWQAITPQTSDGAGSIARNHREIQKTLWSTQSPKMSMKPASQFQMRSGWMCNEWAGGV
jgi:hypothetical protein